MLGPLKNKIPPQVRKTDQAVIIGDLGRGLALPQLGGGGESDQRWIPCSVEELRA
jgi:hypothetical protein